MCVGCPFDYFSEETDKYYNYGCLPGAHEILEDMEAQNKNWACHDNPSKICKGLLNYANRMKDPLNAHLNKVIEIDFKKELLLIDGIHK